MFFVNRELKRHPGVPLRTRLWALNTGFFSESVPLFGLEESNLDRYLSNWEHMKARKINGRLGHVHRNKSMFYYAMTPEWSDAIPDCYGLIRNGQLDQLPVSVHAGSDLLSCVESAGAVVVRPQEGSGGEDVHIVSDEPDGFAIDGSAVTRHGVKQLSAEAEGCLVTEYIEQGPFARSLYPDSPNTLRFLTMVDPETTTPYIAAAVQRIGTDASVPVDNWSKGGIAANVDIESGTLSHAVSYPEGSHRGEHEVHPETGAQIAQRTVPDWDAILDEILAMADYLAPLTPYVGWDVLLTGEGSFKVIEGNDWPDVDVIQPHVPLLADERNRRFFEHHGVI
ncbi:sugar-transfer associated ATP-grasp domain-containing protein [Halovivax gelatinilyticus]|uniref:sugar-transfer associated ATP-grasp domain-containing protein n=1 Tax=Halovivax gelatinilyticus TaxID=2961597 RepID=UPI0020CA82BD|nr:sugar-transfer associated ATP-grasp domain-containing protein [Halovivax gelatinilyticus]